MQVMSEHTAEAQSASHHDVEQGYVAVSVSAHVPDVYKVLKVSFCCCLHGTGGAVLYSGSTSASRAACASEFASRSAKAS